MDQDKKFMDALAAFQGPQPPSSAQSLDLCATYHKVKPILDGILPFLKLIPKIGAPAAAAIQALMSVLDAACPSGAQAATMVKSGPDDDAFTVALAQFQPAGSSALVSAQTLDICATYKKVKPILQGVLPFLSLIPVIGVGVSAAVTLLMNVLDSTCTSGN